MTVMKRTMIAELEITESGDFAPVPAWAMQEHLQRLVDPALGHDDPWALTAVTVYENPADYDAKDARPTYHAG